MDLRTLARIVATADLILIGMSLKILYFYSNFGLMTTIFAPSSGTEDGKAGKNYIWLTAIICWFPFMLALVLVLAQVFAANKLFSSTQFRTLPKYILLQRMQPGQAVIRARFWRNVTLGFILLALTDVALGPEEYTEDGKHFIVLLIVLKIIGFFIVYFWIKEQQQLDNRNNFGTPCVVYGFEDNVYTKNHFQEEMANERGDKAFIKV